MAKLTKKQIIENNEKVYLLHREFVRRNAEYAEQYQKLKKIGKLGEFNADTHPVFHDWGLIYEDTLPDPENLNKINYIDKVKLPFVVSELPSDDYDICMPGRESRNFSIDIFDVIKKRNYDDLKGSLHLTYIPEEPETAWTSDIDVRHSKRDISLYLNGMLDSIIKSREKHGLKQARQKDKFRLDQWVEYIKVYDLRKVGKKYRDIAETMWNTEEGDIERKVRLYYQKAEKLVKDPPISKIIFDRYLERFGGKKVPADKNK